MGKRRRQRSREEWQAIFAKRNKGYFSRGSTTPNPFTQSSRLKSESLDPHIRHFIMSGIDLIGMPKRPKPKKTPTARIKPKKQVQTTEPQKIINTIKKIPPDKFLSIIGIGASLATGSPFPLLAVQSYKAVKIINDVSKRMENIKLKEEFKDLLKQHAEASTQKALEKKTEEISKKIADQSQDAGLTRLLAEATLYNEKSANMLFQNTVSNLINDGIGDLTSLAVDTVL